MPLEFFSSVAHYVDSQSLVRISYFTSRVILISWSMCLQHILFDSALERVFSEHQNSMSLSAPTLSLYFDLMDFFSSNLTLAKVHQSLPDILFVLMVITYM